MPIYEYQCFECGRITERISKVADMRDLATCQHCGDAAKRIISMVAIQDDNPAWINRNLLNSVCAEDGRHVGTRSELNAYCKQHGIVENPK